MKTFNIALEHLAALEFKGIDFSSFENFQKTSAGKVDIEPIKKKYLNDTRLTSSNETYYLTCLEIALYHWMEKTFSKKTSFDMAMEIVKGSKLRMTEDDGYPQELIDQFKKAIAAVPDPPFWLREPSEMTIDIFYVAYHYVVDEKS